MATPTEDEMRKQIDLTSENNYDGMTYADGVRAALEWALGDTTETPFEEEL